MWPTTKSRATCWGVPPRPSARWDAAISLVALVSSFRVIATRRPSENRLRHFRPGWGALHRHIVHPMVSLNPQTCFWVIWSRPNCLGYPRFRYVSDWNTNLTGLSKNKFRSVLCPWLNVKWRQRTLRIVCLWPRITVVRPKSWNVSDATLATPMTSSSRIGTLRRVTCLAAWPARTGKRRWTVLSSIRIRWNGSRRLWRHWVHICYTVISIDFIDFCAFIIRYAVEQSEIAPENDRFVCSIGDQHPVLGRGRN